MAKGRFQDLEIWKMAIEIADELFNKLNHLSRKVTNFQKTLKKQRYAPYAVREASI